jgi:hypothetical protein
MSSAEQRDGFQDSEKIDDDKNIVVNATFPGIDKSHGLVFGQRTKLVVEIDLTKITQANIPTLTDYPFSVELAVQGADVLPNWHASIQPEAGQILQTVFEVIPTDTNFNQLHVQVYYANRWICTVPMTNLKII